MRPGPVELIAACDGVLYAHSFTRRRTVTTKKNAGRGLTRRIIAMAGLLDRLKGLVKDREGQIKSAVDKAGDFVDDKTKGKYHDKIAKAGEKADQVIDKVKADGTDAADSADSAPAAADPAASASTATDAPAETAADVTETATDSAADPGTDAGTDPTAKPSA
jgi:hypothetical protein